MSFCLFALRHALRKEPKTKPPLQNTQGRHSFVDERHILQNHSAGSLLNAHIYAQPKQIHTHKETGSLNICLPDPCLCFQARCKRINSSVRISLQPLKPNKKSLISVLFSAALVNHRCCFVWFFFFPSACRWSSGLYSYMLLPWLFVYFYSPQHSMNKWTRTSYGEACASSVGTHAVMVANVSWRLKIITFRHIKSNSTYVLFFW